MNPDDVMPRLQALFDEIFLEPPRLTRALSAKEVPEWDSLTQISLLVAVEKGFGIRFRMGEVEATRNIGDFVDLIARRASEAKG